MAMKPTTIEILNYLKAHADENITSEQLAEILGLTKRQVDGSFTQAFQNKGHGMRVEAEVELPDGSHKKVKYLKLTPSGMEYEPEPAE